MSISSQKNKICVICCFASEDVKGYKISRNKHFGKFVHDLNISSNCNGDLGARKFLNTLDRYYTDKVNVCHHCSTLISDAMTLKDDAAEMEMHILKLQKIITDKLKEYKKLMDFFCERMKEISNTVEQSDVEVLKSCVTVTGVITKKCQPDVHSQLISFREKIQAVVADLANFHKDLKKKVIILDNRHSSTLSQSVSTKATNCSVSTRITKVTTEIEIKEEIIDEEEREDDNDPDVGVPVPCVERYKDESFVDDSLSDGDITKCKKPTKCSVSTRISKITPEIEIKEEEIDKDDKEDDIDSAIDVPASNVELSENGEHSEIESSGDVNLSSDFAKFKKALLRILRLPRIFQNKSIYLNSIPPEEKYPLGYDKKSGKITVADTHIKLIEDDPNNPILQCTSCNFRASAEQAKFKVYKLVDKLYNHVASCHYNAFDCHHCHKKLLSRKKFREHLIAHADLSKNSITCDICGKPFARSYNVAAHRWIHFSDEEKAEAIRLGKAPKRVLISHHTCSICGRTFSDRTSLLRHEARHGDRQKMTCPKCGKEMIRESYLFHHAKFTCPTGNYQANAAARIKCALCDNTYKTSISLQNHIKNVHSEEAKQRSFICKLCGKGYRSAWDLKCHARTHSTERPWKCEFCGKDFNIKKYLLGHQRKCRKKAEAEKNSFLK